MPERTGSYCSMPLDASNVLEAALLGTDSELLGADSELFDSNAVLDGILAPAAAFSRIFQDFSPHHCGFFVFFGPPSNFLAHSPTHHLTHHS